MKKLFALFLIGALLFSGCQSSARALTAEEIAQVNDAFFFMQINEDGVYAANPLPCFVMDYYSDVSEMPLKNFLLYFPADADVTDAAEYEALKADPDFLFGQAASPEELPVPIHRISADSINAYLTKWSGLTLDDLKNKDGTIYAEEYDAYYTTTSDAGGAYFTCESGRLNGDTVTLEGSGSAGSSVLTLKKNGDSWQIVSHQPK